jgi:hypothetical protein
MRVVSLKVLVLAASVGASTIAQDLRMPPVGLGLRIIRTHSSIIEVELSNAGAEPVMYFHWFGSGVAPVPYCKSKSGSVRICALQVSVDAEGIPDTHERPIDPGKSVVFSAAPGRDEVVGVRLWFHGAETYIWKE